MLPVIALISSALNTMDGDADDIAQLWRVGAAYEPAALHHCAMSTGSHFVTNRPCWYCVHWAGPCWGDPYMADCRHGGVKSCKADAANGCVHWMRETGVDDDAWRPAPAATPMTPQKREEIDPAAIAFARLLDGRRSLRSTR